MNIRLKQILEQIKLEESIDDKGLFKAIFFAGIPGSGKSYVINKITDGAIMPRIVNTDTYTEFLSKKIGKDISPEFDSFVDVIKKVTVDQLSSYVNGALPIFIDGTSNNPSSLFKRDGLLKSYGYDTGMVWINTDLDQALSRAKQRSRSVPEKLIRTVHQSLAENKNYYRSHFKFFIEVDNNNGELTNDSILRAYKQVRSFYTSPIHNPIGIKNLEKMKSSSGYLVPSVVPNKQNIINNVRGWYNV